MPKTSSRMEPSIPLGEFDPAKREMRIFISSTFRDMQKIRDVIMCKIFPLMQREADERQVRLIPIDLRWGITEEESQSGKVLGICLDEIEIPFVFPTMISKPSQNNSTAMIQQIGVQRVELTDRRS